MSRPTIRDIARVAGVNPAAVSFTLNDRPGASEETRKRIAAVARDMGWSPNAAARALSVRSAGAIGLVIARPEQSFSSERFFFELIVGLQSQLSADGKALVLQVAKDVNEESEIHRRWWSGRTVDGIILIDLRENDPRPATLAQLGVPTVIVGQPSDSLGAVVGDEEGIMRKILEHLIEEGCTRIAYVSGFTSLAHITQRARTLSQIGRKWGIEVQLSTATDFTEDSALEHTKELLQGPRRPDAIIYDNEILTLGGYQALRTLGLTVGEDIAVVSCEDSAICRVLTPAVTAIHREPSTVGVHTAEVLTSMLAGGPATTVLEETPELIVRASSQLR